MRALLILLLFSSAIVQAQDVKKSYYPKGQLKSEVVHDKAGVMTKYSYWDQYGNLLTVKDYVNDYKSYPKRDFTKTKWTPVSAGVSISKFVTQDHVSEVTDSSQVTIHYQCYLESGQMVDNSFARNCPLVVRLDKMVPGFIKGVKAMNPGETALIRIEPAQGFGPKAAGNVPANSVLVYLVEFDDIQ